MTTTLATEYSADSTLCCGDNGRLPGCPGLSLEAAPDSHNFLAAAKGPRRHSAHALFNGFGDRLYIAGICRNARAAQQCSPLSHQELDDACNCGDRR